MSKTDVRVSKKDLVEKIATATGVKKSEVDKVIGELVDTIKASVKKGEIVQLHGFGSFTKYERKPRTGTNPQTRKQIKIGAKQAVRFKPSKAFKDSLN